jgi:alkylation response protein AidB-like acyl-CoA dehydrogenase
MTSADTRPKLAGNSASSNSHGTLTSPTLQRVRELTPAIRQRGDEIESARRLPPDLVADLLAAGCFRMHVPVNYGGCDLPLTDALDVVEQLAYADGSTGWTVMIGSHTPVLFGLLPRATFETIYARGPDVIGAGSLAPSGRAVPVEGGFRVSGQWSFASGCQHADWIVAHAIVVNGNEPRLLPDGVPEMVVGVFPPNDVQIVDTWRVVGMQGTGSHDVLVQDAYCPAERTFRLFGAAPSVDAAIFSIPPLSVTSIHQAAVALGIARAALDDIAELAGGGKRRLFAVNRLAESAVFQDALGQADVTLRAARALLRTDADAAWGKAIRREEFVPLDRARLRATAAQVMRMAIQVVDAAYTAGGGTAIYASSPLQRRLRDIHVQSQHIAVSRDAFGVVGTLLAGEEPDPRLPF